MILNITLSVSPNRDVNRSKNMYYPNLCISMLGRYAKIDIDVRADVQVYGKTLSRQYEDTWFS